MFYIHAVNLRGDGDDALEEIKLFLTQDARVGGNILQKDGLLHQL